jgi:hypothetical protein
MKNLPRSSGGAGPIQHLAIRALLVKVVFAGQAVAWLNAEANFALIIVVPEVFQRYAAHE